MGAPRPKPHDPKNDRKWVPCAECKEPVDVHITTAGEVICRKCSAPDWEGRCDVCGESPTVPQTGMCGPCTWGEGDTAGGNW